MTKNLSGSFWFRVRELIAFVFVLPLVGLMIVVLSLIGLADVLVQRIERKWRQIRPW